MRQLDSITNSVDVNLMAKDREAWRAAVHGVAKAPTLSSVPLGSFEHWTQLRLENHSRGLLIQ